mgnify:CR=1 FL=1
MLTTIRQVNEQFFRKFYGIKMQIGGAEKVVLCRYAKKSSYDYVEEQTNQIYPCIVIQDYTPTPKDEWYIDMRSYFGGKSFNGLTGYLYQRPIWMEFRYDVSIIAKSYNDFISMQDYFMQHFVYGVRFIFNQKLDGENAVGDIVPYNVRETTIPRTDGLFEMNYEFTCSVWLYSQTPSEVALVKKIVINAMIKKTISESETPKFAVKIIPYDGGSFDGNANKTQLGIATLIGGMAELAKEDLGGFQVSLYDGDRLFDRQTTQLDGIVSLDTPTKLGEYKLTISKDSYSAESFFTLKEINSDLVFLWVFE